MPSALLFQVTEAAHRISHQVHRILEHTLHMSIQAIPPTMLGMVRLLGPRRLLRFFSQRHAGEHLGLLGFFLLGQGARLDGGEGGGEVLECRGRFGVHGCGVGGRYWSHRIRDGRRRGCRSPPYLLCPSSSRQRRRRRGAEFGGQAQRLGGAMAPRTGRSGRRRRRRTIARAELVERILPLDAAAAAAARCGSDDGLERRRSGDGPGRRPLLERMRRGGRRCRCRGVVREELVERILRLHLSRRPRRRSSLLGLHLRHGVGSCPGNFRRDAPGGGGGRR
mmetsp:Transcript_45579/g.84477  ORF Transcript_45579/g.84477 Transcript_45579/m.84477 type:complete len:279 (+) Transcript_45579:2243-3079(+)